jgi:hypothetical protein
VAEGGPGSDKLGLKIHMYWLYNDICTVYSKQ